MDLAPAAVDTAPVADAKVSDTAPVADTKVGASEAPAAGNVDAASAPQSWVEQRAAWAKGDEKALAWASRYSSNAAVLDALKATQKKLSEGVAPITLGENTTPEELTAYRTAHGVPAAFTDYEVELPDGVELTEEGEGIFGQYLEAMHKEHASQAQVNAGLKSLLGQHVASEAAKEQKDIETAANTKAQLRQEWGPEAPANYNGINNLIATAPEAIQAGLLDARMPDGLRLKDSPEAMRWLANLSRETNPMPTVVPATGMGTMQTLDARIAELTAMSGDRSEDSQYWHGPQAQKFQEEFTRLISEKDRYTQKR